VGSVFEVEIIGSYQGGMFLSNFKYDKRFDPKAAPFGFTLFADLLQSYNADNRLLLGDLSEFSTHEMS
jgi:hypothetical protein